ncbi:hypothetical protein IF188_18900 [Microbacterium sp. NEAU-LLC]|uniref:WXG100 family type VII secretion target n=1 Tax=Microbacterium helvum TaxID=2773713 RepID=A0ABR8NXG8_9MICO|nr:hypothetical protein [Microbacterium helvum]MBD3943766.1 hypothetical protein [Microbacterium helvum]
MTYLSPGPSASHQLDIVAYEVARLIERLEDAAAHARRLSGETQWQARAATAFHEQADAWAGEVSGLRCLAETVRLEAARARDRAAFAESAWFASLQGGAAR